MFNIVSAPTTIAYLPTALGASKTTLLLSNNPSSGPYAWQLPQCTITSNPYSDGVTGTYGLLNCVAIDYGAISVVVWFYLSPGGQGTLLGYSDAQYPASSVNHAPLLYVGTNGYLFGMDGLYNGGRLSVSTSSAISPGWHMAVIEEWASGTSGPFYMALYLDGQFIRQSSASGSGSTPGLFGSGGPYPYSDIGTGDGFNYGYTNGGWFFFNGAIAFVALYNRVLTTGDVLAIWQGNLVSSGLAAVWYGDDYNPSNGYWVSRVGGYTGVQSHLRTHRGVAYCGTQHGTAGRSALGVTGNSANDLLPALVGGLPININSFKPKSWTVSEPIWLHYLVGWLVGCLGLGLAWPLVV